MQEIREKVDLPSEPQLYGKASGTRGSFFATVSVRGREDALLPCVLGCWFNRLSYCDPLGGRNTPKLRVWHEAMRDLQQVVFARVEVTSAEGSNHITLRRQDYLGVYKISDLKIDNPHLRFVREKLPIIRL